MKKNILLLLLAVSSLIIAGCNGGGSSGLTVGSIIGDATVDENTSEVYTITASGDTGITYQWTVTPATAGTFTGATTSSATFTAGSVTADMTAVINCEVNSTGDGPVVASLNITIIDTGALTVSSITGPATVDENTNGVYSITAADDTGITYQWSVNPVSAGTFTGDTTASTTFHASDVLSDTPAVIECEVNSDNGGPVTETLNITVIDTTVLSNGWALTWGDTEDDWNYGATVTASGHVYCVGRFGGTVDFDPSAAVSNLTSNGGDDCFLSSFDTDGNFEWAVNWGDITNDYALDVAVNSTGDVFVVGWFTGLVDFDPGPIVIDHLATGHDAFLTAFNSSGDFQWVHVWGGPNNDSAGSVSVDGSDNLYVGGEFAGTADLDPGLLTTDDRISAGSYDVYLSKFDAAGTWEWAADWGGTGTDSLGDIISDTSGNTLIIGGFNDTVDFVTGIYASNGGLDVYLSNIDTNGIFQWTQVWGGTGFDNGFGIALDSSGNIYITGLFNDTVDFDPSVTVENHTSTGGHDAYLCSYNSAGVYQWTLDWGGTMDDLGEDVVVDASGNMYVAGEFEGTCDVDPSAAVENLVSVGSHDISLSRFDSSGNLDWAIGWGDFSWDSPYAVDLDSSGNVYVAGHFLGTVDFDPGPTTDDHISAGGSDAFVMKLLPTGLWN